MRGDSSQLLTGKAHARAGQSGDDFEIVGLVDAASVILVLNRVTVQRVGSRLRIEQYSVARVSEILDDGCATSAFTHTHVVADFHMQRHYRRVELARTRLCQPATRPRPPHRPIPWALRAFVPP